MRGADSTAPRLRAGARGSNQRGLVTVELAIGFVALVLMLGTLAGVVMLGISQSAIQAISVDLARYTARNDDAMADAVRERAPANARIQMDHEPDGVRVTTYLDVPVLNLGAVPLRATAWADWEPGAGP